MVVHTISPVAALHGLFLLTLLIGAQGCQTGQPVSSRRLIEHQALIDFSGLKGQQAVESVRVMCSPPRQWTELDPHRSPLYVHQQWRSPSGHTGVGVAFCHLPLPLSAKMVVWLAKTEYSKQSNNGKVLGEWTDALGRSWFEASNDKYHVRGYVVVNGLSAWIVYFGYKTRYAPDPGEVSLAARSADTIVPIYDGAAPATQPVAAAALASGD